jgi:Immunity protein 44
MTFWFSGELDHRIADAYRPVRARVEAKLNARCGGRDYGDAVTKIAIIPMILSPEFLQGRPERRLWQRKQHSADYRTVIDFEKFRSGADAVRERLLVRNTMEAIRHLQKRARAGLRGDELVSDILLEFGLTPSEVEDD